jgi:ketosteroid isomerase-like protein
MDETLERYFRAMQRGPEGEDELIALFAEDAVYIEPFRGQLHAGRDAIRSYLRDSWPDQPPGIRLTVERRDIIEQVVEATWTCESDAFSRPARGRDRFTIRDGQIIRLESQLTDPPRLKP